MLQSVARRLRSDPALAHARAGAQVRQVGSVTDAPCPHDRCPVPTWLAVVLLVYLLAMVAGVVLVVAWIIG